jgi:hypothetical protein
MKSVLCTILSCALMTGAFAADAFADEIHAHEGDAPPDFDILSVSGQQHGDLAVFAMEVAGQAEATLPDAVGELQGASVFAYVWPLSADPSVVGFPQGAGTLALVATSHPDFDDTPLYDENGDGDFGNDGAGWHSHWVVLVPDETCGTAGLKVADISPAEDIVMPATAPGLPILLDSPDVGVDLEGHGIALEVEAGPVDGASFDGVTATLTVDTTPDTPLLCVTGIFDVASGDLSLPGRLD